MSYFYLLAMPGLAAPAARHVQVPAQRQARYRPGETPAASLRPIVVVGQCARLTRLRPFGLLPDGASITPEAATTLGLVASTITG